VLLGVCERVEVCDAVCERVDVCEAVCVAEAVTVSV
jgi:hypothetical protein